jgi:tetratricopeptide (TPR) repeat protein
MELVHGVPITKYCDDNRLTPRQRLELFVPVCQAIQHAHQKGIIHRDIKPSNVMVTLYDGKPVPKVIDFGVAKATEQKLTERTLFTQYGTMVGTLEYMSPEQAEMSALGVDTRSDIYSLGVLLYELLTGSTPISGKRMKGAAYAEILRLIKEEEPPKPSTRLSDSGEALASISAQRQTEPTRLTKLVRGELDWIVMKCLDKDRNRRYETANDFAADVQRYLADEAVQACPPSAGYRLRKFVRRNKTGLLAASLVILALIVGMIGTTSGMVRAEQQRQNAEVNEKKALGAAEAEKEARTIAQTREAAATALLDFIEKRILAAPRPRGQEGGLGRDVTLREALEAALPFVDKSFTDEPIIEARLRNSLGSSSLCLGDAKTAAEQFEKARKLYVEHLGADELDTLRCINNLAVSYSSLDRHDEALKLQEDTLPLLKAKLGPRDAEVLRSMDNLAVSRLDCGQPAEAARLHEETLELRKTTLGPDHADTLRSMHNLANSYASLGNRDEAQKLREQALPLLKASLGPDHPETLMGMNNLANSYDNAGRHQEALQLHEATLALRAEKLGPSHPDTLQSMNNLAVTYAYLGKHDDALKLREKILPLMKAGFGPDHTTTLRAMNNLAFGYSALQRHEEARQLFEETLALQKAALGPDNPNTLLSMWGVADSLVKLKRGAEGVPIIDDCVQRAEGQVVDRRLIPCVMDLRLEHFAKAKDAAGCRATAEMWEKLKRAGADGYFTAARMRAVTATVIQQDAGIPAADRDRRAQEEGDRAIHWLREAVATGYRNLAHLKSNKDFDALRDRADFIRLLAEMESGARKNSQEK